MRKIACFPKYGTLAASTRQRFCQFIGALQAAGMGVSLQPLLGNDYMSSLYRGRGANLRAVLGAYFRRYGALSRLDGADLIWLHYEAFPYLPWFIERAAFNRGIPTVFDLDDAIFHRYDLHENGLVRRLLGSKIDRGMASADLVIAGNAYLAERAKAAGARDVRIVPTVLDVDMFTVGPRARADVNAGPAAIGWIGAPSTWAEYMVPMLPVLTGVAQAEGARLKVVGAGRAIVAHPLIDDIVWSEETEVARIQEMDIGVMPLDDSPWARGKCGYKLIQYMACGLPVVASPVGVNAEIVEHGVNGFLATTHQEWNAALTTLLRDPDLRRRMGAAGRRKVEEAYSLQVWGPRLAALLAGVAGRVV